MIKEIFGDILFISTSMVDAAFNPLPLALFCIIIIALVVQFRRRSIQDSSQGKGAKVLDVIAVLARFLIIFVLMNVILGISIQAFLPRPIDSEPEGMVLGISMLFLCTLVAILDYRHQKRKLDANLENPLEAESKGNNLDQSTTQLAVEAPQKFASAPLIGCGVGGCLLPCVLMLFFAIVYNDIGGPLFWPIIAIPLGALGWAIGQGIRDRRNRSSKGIERPTLR